MERSLTARRNDFSSACRGSSEATGGLLTPICGFTEGVPGERAATQLDELLAAAVGLAASLRDAPPLGPAPLAARF